MEQKKQVRISVRALVEFVLRSGDIDNRRSGAAQKDAMAAGTRIHKKIQKRMGGNYRAEVPLKYAALDEEEDIELLVEGRADGIFEEDGIVTIDEIKGVYMDLERLTEPVAVHMAQAMCYGYFYCCDRNLDGVRIQLTYCNLETEEIRRFHEDRSKEELEAWFRSVIHEYFKWARYLCHHELQRNQSISGLEFPFPYREGQRDLAVAVYKTISRKKRLFIQAPTGIGKTLSTIFPAVQAMGAGKASKVFYLTAKTITRTVAEEAFRILRSRGLVFTAVTITAKEKLCPMEKAECNPEACPYAKGHFDRVNEAVFDILHLEQEMDRETVLRYAEKYRVCPFEFCLDISSWTDGIICDYNYVFDPNVRLKRYFADGASGDYLFLVDEAHNLVSRAREMYSASVYKEDFLEVKRIIKGKSPRLERQLDRCNKLLLSMKRECGDWQLLEDVTGLAAGIMTAFSYMETFMEEFPEFPERETVLDFYFCLRDFLNVYEELDGHYRIYEENREDGSFLVRLFCVDPSRLLSRCMDQGASTILFSATLLPVRYYKTLLSGNQEDYAVYVNSPFPEENRLLMVAEDVSSRYTRRSPSEYRKVADYIRIVTQSRPGNYMVFFPSYQYMGEIEEILEEEPLKADLLVQGQGMGEAEKAEFLEEFEKERSHSLAAFCVMGGVFSEGIDLKEERLIG
ncbi:helicase C-terminal domain-containing protein, partial [Enterocloster sp.]